MRAPPGDRPSAALPLSALRGLLIDLDGVVFRGDIVLPGAPEFFRFLRQIGLPFLLITNNSTLTASQYVAKLGRMEIDIAESEVLGSAGATAHYLASVAPAGARVLVVGEDGLRTAVAQVGLEVADDDVSYVVIGLDRSLDYQKLTRAVRAIRSGATFVGSNPDTTLPTPDGIIPGAGAIQAAVTAATGITPVLIGKPEPAMLLMAAARLGLAPADIAIIGDRLDTDVEGGRRVGATTIMVLTGVSSLADVERSAHKPDYLFANLPEVQRALAQR